jgi:uncharacterized protein
MRPSPEAKINLAPLLTHAPGSDDEVEADGLLQPTDEQLHEDGVRLAEPLSWEVTVRNAGGDDDLLADGRVEGVAILECRRCLKDVETPVEAEFFYAMLYRPGQDAGLTLVENPSLTGPVDDGDEDVLTFGRPEVDLAPLLRQVFAIDLPLTVLCSETCRGLSLDGVDLNEHPGHQGPVDRASPDSPFASLGDIDWENRS